MPRSAPRVSLAALNTAERAPFLEAQAAEYADEKARAGVWTREESVGRSREEIRRLLATPSAAPHRFYQGLDAARRVVGWIWLGPMPGGVSDPAVFWLYQITVAPQLRGQGYGRALLRAAEAEVRALGGREVRLNVFAWNRVALSLYQSSGYETLAEDESGSELRKSLA